MNNNINADVLNNSYEEVVEDIRKVLKDRGLTIRQSLDILKTIDKSIVLSMPITDSLDSIFK